MAARFERVAIIGTGLIGSSLALALKSMKNAPTVLGFDVSGNSRRGAASLKTPTGAKAFDRVSGDLSETVRLANLIVLTAPIGVIEVLLRDLALIAPESAIVLDTASTKEQVLAWAAEILPTTVDFVGGHPIVSKLGSGPHEADGSLFQNSLFCLCLPTTTRSQTTERIVKLVEDLGATPYFLDAREHDGLAAAVDHLPYLTAAALIRCVSRERAWREAAMLAGMSFATATHLSEVDPQALADICLTSSGDLVQQLDLLISELAELRDAIASGDSDLRSRFSEAQQRHREWISGRASEEPSAQAAVSTAELRPSNLFVPGKLMDLLRGRNKKSQPD